MIWLDGWGAIGGTDALGFAHAVDVAMDMVTHHFNDRIREGLSRLAESLKAEDIELTVRYFGLGYPEHMSE